RPRFDMPDLKSGISDLGSHTPDLLAQNPPPVSIATADTANGRSAMRVATVAVVAASVWRPASQRVVGRRALLRSSETTPSAISAALTKYPLHGGAASIHPMPITETCPGTDR